MYKSKVVDVTDVAGFLNDHEECEVVRIVPVGRTTKVSCGATRHYEYSNVETVLVVIKVMV